MRTIFQRSLGWASAVLLAVSLPCARANTYPFMTAPGAFVTDALTGATANVSAFVSLITSNNQLEIQISNLTTPQIGSVIETIGEVDWLSTGPGSSVTPSNPSSYLGNMINLCNKNTTPACSGTGTFEDSFASTLQYNPTNWPTPAGPPASGQESRWLPFASTQITGGFKLTTYSGGNPAQTILGPPDASGACAGGLGSNPNCYKSNTGLRGDDPFLQTLTASTGGNATTEMIDWKLPVTGMTASTMITRVRLSWGTGAAVPQELELISAVPEPFTLGLSAGGFLLLCAFYRSNLKRARK